MKCKELWEQVSCNTGTKDPDRVRSWGCWDRRPGALLPLTLYSPSVQICPEMGGQDPRQLTFTLAYSYEQGLQQGTLVGGQDWRRFF